MSRIFVNIGIRFSRSESGVTLVEYGIALILAVTVGVFILNQLGVGVNTQLNDANALM